MRRRSLLAVLLGAALCAGPPAAAQQAPPPTPVPPFGSPSPFPTSLETPPPTTRPPTVTAASAALFEVGSGEVLHAFRPDDRRPIASTTKIMTALLVLEASDPGDVVVASDNAASQEGAVLGLEPGEERTIGQLLHALLLQSANDAAVALAEHVAGDVSSFVDLMNRRARRLGLRDTRFESPNGLDDDGYSTVHDMVVLATSAHRDRTFGEVVATKFATIPSPDGEPRRIQNRNALLWLYRGALGTKTGYTAAAGFCIVAAAERKGEEMGAIVLGAPDEAFSDAAALLNYGFEAFERQLVIAPGGALDPIEVEGTAVPVEAGSGLEVLVRTDRAVEIDARPRDGLALPIREGDVVGAAVATAEGEALGRVALVAEGDILRPAPEERPWWEPVRDFLIGLFEAVLD
jgi:serine-type D-Ala-D-Ala carboxypeptidase (penicillin-binding protein 5/6)